MPLRFKYRDLWFHGKMVPKRIYAQLEDLQNQIDSLKAASDSSKESSEKEPSGDG